jgi:GNAT superfamily N-acetyltransferase
MATLKVYSRVEDFLEETEIFLMQKELENNHILGNCYNVLNAGHASGKHYFINSLHDKKVVASSIMISSKAIVAGSDPVAIQQLSSFYHINKISLKGVIGPRFSAATFADYHRCNIDQNRTTLVQGLEKTNSIALAEGILEPSRPPHLPLLVDWGLKFYEEEKIQPKKSPEEIKLYMQTLLYQGDLFSWICKGRPVSMAGIIRKTRNTAIIGYVYTPRQLRGKGFGKSCVHQLSHSILKQGFRQSGLLVYESNLPARKMYQQIGYQTISEFLDIDFE